MSRVGAPDRDRYSSGVAAELLVIVGLGDDLVGRLGHGFVCEVAQEIVWAERAIGGVDAVQTY